MDSILVIKKKKNEEEPSQNINQNSNETNNMSEIAQLKIELENYKKLLDIKDLLIAELKKQLNETKNYKSNENIKLLEDEINKKENELKKTNELNNITLNNNSNNNTMILVFNSLDQTIKEFSLSCLPTDTFAEVEEKLYKNFPQLREDDNYFLCNAKKIVRFKTILENNIKSGQKVIIAKIVQ